MDNSDDQTPSSRNNLYVPLFDENWLSNEAIIGIVVTCVVVSLGCLWLGCITTEQSKNQRWKETMTNVWLKRNKWIAQRKRM
jgi:hypothetical protein